VFSAGAGVLICESEALQELEASDNATAYVKQKMGIYRIYMIKYVK
jgi:hypothetical protein